MTTYVSVQQMFIFFQMNKATTAAWLNAYMIKESKPCGNSTVITSPVARTCLQKEHSHCILSQQDPAGRRPPGGDGRAPTGRLGGPPGVLGREGLGPPGVEVAAAAAAAAALCAGVAVVLCRLVLGPEPGQAIRLALRLFVLLPNRDLMSFDGLP
eukprot:CAMPEP_0194728202 /NCGR_PEP_ID=MMETSP0296-20130528/38739_1 /TAXON_ID=39354 /ORGANISM="Heterosigma akashiwo, Strain CCMP2393" /LENGTH=154 /DNA_ID=CAMNT_0039633971 /DNA_START=53 /DNA_END=516 /DNA_ORIENTATION=-